MAQLGALGDAHDPLEAVRPGLAVMTGAPAACNPAGGSPILACERRCRMKPTMPTATGAPKITGTGILPPALFTIASADPNRTALSVTRSAWSGTRSTKCAPIHTPGIE